MFDAIRSWTGRLTLSLLLCLLFLATVSQVGATGRRSADLMVEAAANLIRTLDDSQKEKALLPFEGDHRFDWHYIPKTSRKGLSLKEMNSTQLHLANALLNAGLSNSGFAKAASIMSNEWLVRDREMAEGRRSQLLQLRDPLLYYFTLFGEPSTEAPWGWSIEGHHISLNYTLVGGFQVATSPFFFGGEPHEVLEGPRKGQRILGREEDLARALLGSLDEEQSAKAHPSTEAPRDMLTAANRTARIEGAPVGLPSTEMTIGQLVVLRELIDEYVFNLPPDLAGDRTAAVEEAWGQPIYFVWLGTDKRGPGNGHYYRVQASTFLIEYDNVQFNANHSHSVWRDWDGDFGLDLLAEHYRRDHGQSQSSGRTHPED